MREERVTMPHIYTGNIFIDKGRLQHYACFHCKYPWFLRDQAGPRGHSLDRTQRMSSDSRVIVGLGHRSLFICSVRFRTLKSATQLLFLE